MMRLFLAWWRAYVSTSHLTVAEEEAFFPAAGRQAGSRAVGQLPPRASSCRLASSMPSTWLLRLAALLFAARPGSSDSHTATRSVRDSARTLTTAPECIDHDENVSRTTGGFNCADLAALAQCPIYFCSTCIFAGLCDVSCSYCLTPTIAPSTSSLCINDDAAASALTGYECSTLASAGYCDSYLCPTCAYSGICDETCGFCPTPAPTMAPCVDDDMTASVLTGYECSTLSSAGYCDAYLCPVCAYSGICDETCGYCPTPAPTMAPCVDDDMTASALTGYECATLSSAGYCDAYLCPACAYSGICDETCGYCPTSSDVVSGSPTMSPVPSLSFSPTPIPTTTSPTVAPTTAPTTSNPTVSVPPSLSHAPTLTGDYEVSTDAQLRDQITAAEDGREWILTVTGDFSSVNRTFVIARYKHIKVIDFTN